MQENETAIRKVGNSAGVLLNKAILYKANIDVGDQVKITCSANRITIKKVKEKKDAKGINILQENK